MAWAKFWYNTSYHLATHYTLFKVIYGQPTSSLAIYEIGKIKNNEVEKKFLDKNEELSKVKTKLKRAQERMKWYYNQGGREEVFELGTMSI